MNNFIIKQYLPISGQYCAKELFIAVDDLPNYSNPINLNKAISYNFGKFIEQIIFNFGSNISIPN